MGNHYVTIHVSRCLFQVAFQSYANHHREKGAISTNYELSVVDDFSE